MKTKMAEKIFSFFIGRKSGPFLPKANENELRLAEICAMPADEALQLLSTSEQGLTQSRADALREKFGPNEISREKRITFPSEILRRFENPPVILLLVICVVALTMEDLRSTVIVGGMILMSVFLAYFQETKSNRAVENLRALVQTNSNVLREGKEIEIPMSEIVPGDILALDAGALISADIRLIQAKDFFIHQSALTGKSIPVEKNPDLAPWAAKASWNFQMPALWEAAC